MYLSRTITRSKDYSTLWSVFEHCTLWCGKCGYITPRTIVVANGLWFVVVTFIIPLTPQTIWIPLINASLIVCLTILSCPFLIKWNYLESYFSNNSSWQLSLLPQTEHPLNINYSNKSLAPHKKTVKHDSIFPNYHFAISVRSGRVSTMMGLLYWLTFNSEEVCSIWH